MRVSQSARPSLPVPLFAMVLLTLFWGCASSEQKNPTDPAAQVKLGERYQEGRWSLQDDAAAVEWYRKASLQGDAEGQLHLGRCYAKGEGVPKNNVQAVEWYRKAALQGNAEAQYCLGLCYDRAEGVPKDVVMAYMWLNIAAASDHENAKQCRDAVAYRMTDAQLKQAQQLSRDWEPK